MPWDQQMDALGGTTPGHNGPAGGWAKLRAMQAQDRLHAGPNRNPSRKSMDAGERPRAMAVRKSMDAARAPSRKSRSADNNERPQMNVARQSRKSLDSRASRAEQGTSYRNLSQLGTRHSRRYMDVPHERRSLDHGPRRNASLRNNFIGEMLCPTPPKLLHNDFTGDTLQTTTPTSPLHASQADAMHSNMGAAKEGSSHGARRSVDLNSRAMDTTMSRGVSPAMRLASDETGHASALMTSSTGVKSAMKQDSETGKASAKTRSTGDTHLKLEGQEDPRVKALQFEQSIAAVFDLSPRNGKDKFERAIEKLDENRHHAEELQMQARITSDMEIALKQREEARLAQEAQQRKVKPPAVSGFSRILQKASGLIKRKGGGYSASDNPGMVSRNSSTGKPTMRATHNDALIERRLEAVFVSYALFSKWDGEAMVVGHKCHGLSGLRFLLLCRDAGIMEKGKISDRTARNIFAMHMDKASMSQDMSFPEFVCAIEELAREGRMKPDQVFQAVDALNVEQRICVHN
mmetsp:Transcript_35103/g.88448  ORF Transcript_35103/g.88448 Transcript_35103/m.88448 type:complete len:519 (+) Transcript_35103:202-1758(+)